MKYIRSTIICLIFAVISLINTHVYALVNDTSDKPAIVFENGSVLQIDGVNSEREEGKTIIYTSNYSEYTKPFKSDTREYIVVNNINILENTNGSSGTYIPPNGYVISCTGSSPDLLKNFTAGTDLILRNIDIPVLPDMYFKTSNKPIPIDQVNNIREANQIVLYDSSYGTSTRTNAWGMELTVVNDTVSSISDILNEKGIMKENDSPIPSNGVVISVHSGSPYYKTLHENIKPGDKIAVTADNKLYNASKIKYDAFNPKAVSDNPGGWDKAKNKPYDGYRGPNQVIIYDSNYSSSTGTNAYGFEIAVNSDGYIISTGGNDLEIPLGGYILSGHGDKVKWLQKYAILGAKVKLDADRKELLIVFSPASYVNLASYSIKAAQEGLDSSKLQYMDIPYEKVQNNINTAHSKLRDIEKQVSDGKYGNLTNTVREIQKASDDAYYMTFESLSVEKRAVWLRPRDTSIVQIQKRLDKLKELNINTIFLETYWNGYAIYPTGNAIMPQNPIFKGMDILGIYLQEAHARGIEVHAWVENFLVDQPVAAKKPEWMAVSRKGENFYLENGTTKYYFLNPALPEVHDFLSSLYKGLVTKYNLDGVQFDYMRYSHSGDYSNDFGYDLYTKRLFKGYTGTDPIDLKPGTELWNKWCDFRAYLVSSYAYGAFADLKAIKPNIKLSSDVWPEYDKTLVDIFQDPKAWTRKDYINNLIPMSYYLDEASVVEDIKNTAPFAKGHSQLASGIATFNKVDTKVLLKQIAAIRAAGVNGIAIFEYESLFSGRYADALKLGAFSKPAATYSKNPEQAVKLIFSDILRKLDDIYLKYNGVNMQQADKYKALISSILVDLSNSSDKTKSAYHLKYEIEAAIKTINTDSVLNSDVAQRISSDLNNALNITDAFISEQRFMENHEVRKFQVEIPLQSLENNHKAALRVKALFSDNTSIYLDSSQYTIKSSNPSAVEIAGDNIRLIGNREKSAITIDILESFKFNTLKGVNRKIELLLDEGGKFEGYPPIFLKAFEAGYTGVKLNWESTLTDSEIAFYALYRNDREIARISSGFYEDRTLRPGKTYIYTIQGFNASGEMIFESNTVSVTTKSKVLTLAQ